MNRSRLNQREAAKLLGIHFTFLSQLLSEGANARTPALATAVRIERVTGIPVESWVPPDVADEPEPVGSIRAKARHGKA